jgi:hypothetical protein
MMPTGLFMDKMGNDGEGIVVLMAVLFSIVAALSLGAMVARFFRGKTLKSPRNKET